MSSTRKWGIGNRWLTAAAMAVAVAAVVWTAAARPPAASADGAEPAGIVSLALDDGTTNHVHPAGTSFDVNVTPTVIVGDSLGADYQSVALATGATPFGSTNTANALALLTDGQLSYGTSVGVEYDLWGADDAHNYAEITVDFGGTAEIQSVKLAGFNMNSYYSMRNVTVTFVAPDNTETTVPIATDAVSGQATALYTTMTAQEAKQVRVRAYTGENGAWKLNLTELAMTGKAPGGGALQIPALALTAQWKDYTGAALGSPVSLNVGESNTIASPADPPTGYYGLVFGATGDYVFPDHQIGEAKEYGFAALPPAAARAYDPDSAFGMVHADLNDPYIGGWSKTLEWNPSAFNAAGWQSDIAWREANGWSELPLVTGGSWYSGGTHAVTAAELNQFKSDLGAYLQADTDVNYWELGLEENLHGYGTGTPYYFDNLEQQAAAARSVAEQASPDAKFIYQFAEPTGRQTDLTTFLQSSAARQFDILSLHPYAWPDFPTPETWMQNILDFTRSGMQANGLNMPIWFTEVGAPHQGNAPGEWFGYGDPATGSPVQGLSRQQEAAYLHKIYSLGLAGGVEKIFWYNYRDAGADRTYPEDHFGLVDYWGFPKPAYLAYVSARNRLEDKTPEGVTVLDGDVWVSKFGGTDEDTYVVWLYPGSGSQDVDLAALGLSYPRVTEAVNAVGTPLTLTTDTVRVTGDPIYLTAAKGTNATLQQAGTDDAGRVTEAAQALDGSADTTWVAADAGANHWLQADLGQPTDLAGAEIVWDSRDAHAYKVEVSNDGAAWQTVADRSANLNPLDATADLFTVKARYVRVLVTGARADGQPAAIRELNVFRGAAADPIAAEIQSISLAPGAAPFSSTNTDQALSLLTDGQLSYGANLGVEYDLWGAAANQQYADVTADFGGVADIRSLTLYGFNMNSYYSMKSATVSFTAADDAVTTENMVVGKDASGQTTAFFATDEPKLAKRVTIRVYTGDGGAWKLNLTELQVNGKAPIRPARIESVTAAPGAAPYGSHNEDAAETLLTDGDIAYGSSFGVEYDFWGVPAAQQYADVTVELSREVPIDGVRLDGFNLNGYYAIDHADITYQSTDGTEVTRPATVSNTSGGPALAVDDASAAPIRAKRIVIRVYTGYTYPGTTQPAWKLNLTEVTVTARPSEFASLTLAAETVPFGSHNTDQAAALLTDGATDYGSSFGVEYDLWGAPAGQNDVELDVDLGYEAQIRKLELDGFNLNGYYSIDHVELTFRAADGTEVTASAAGSNAAGGPASAVYTAPGAAVKAQSIVIRAYTGYAYPDAAAWKLNLTELKLQDELRPQP